MDDDREPPEPLAASRMSRHAAEWGLASLLCGAMVLLSLPMVAVFDLLYWVSGPGIVRTAKPEAIALVRYGACFAYLFVIGLTVLGLALGIRALVSARQPSSRLAWLSPEPC
jgi:hypothetical protein